MAKNHLDIQFIKIKKTKSGTYPKTDGQLLTTDSMKLWSRKITKELGIHFKYHNLRYTHASFLAACNTPIPKLKHRLGHTKIETTTKYYIGENEIATDKMKEALKLL